MSLPVLIWSLFLECSDDIDGLNVPSFLRSESRDEGLAGCTGTGLLNKFFSYIDEWKVCLTTEPRTLSFISDERHLASSVSSLMNSVGDLPRSSPILPLSRLELLLF